MCLCPLCVCVLFAFVVGNGELWSDSDQRVELVDLPSFGRVVQLIWHKRQWRYPNRECPSGAFTEQASEIAAPSIAYAIDRLS